MPHHAMHGHVMWHRAMWGPTQCTTYSGAHRVGYSLAWRACFPACLAAVLRRRLATPQPRLHRRHRRSRRLQRTFHLGVRRRRRTAPAALGRRGGRGLGLLVMPRGLGPAARRSLLLGSLWPRGAPERPEEALQPGRLKGARQDARLATRDSARRCGEMHGDARRCGEHAAIAPHAATGSARRGRAYRSKCRAAQAELLRRLRPSLALRPGRSG